MKVIAYKFLKVAFGAIFLLTSVGKLLDNRGFAEVLAHYRLFPTRGLLPLALTLSLGELYLGWLLLRRSRLGALPEVVLLINSGYLALAVITMARGIALTNCGCFGIFLARPLTVNTLYEDGFLVLLSLIFVFVSKPHQRITA